MALVRNRYFLFPGLKPPGFRGYHIERADGSAKEPFRSLWLIGDLPKIENHEFINAPSRWLS